MTMQVKCPKCDDKGYTLNSDLIEGQRNTTNCSCFTGKMLTLQQKYPNLTNDMIVDILLIFNVFENQGNKR